MGIIIIFFINIITSILIDSNMKVVIINNINFINLSSWDDIGSGILSSCLKNGQWDAPSKGNQECF